MAESNGQIPIPSGVGKLEAANRQNTGLCSWTQGGLAPSLQQMSIRVGPRLLSVRTRSRHGADASIPPGIYQPVYGLPGCAWDSSGWTLRLPETGLSGCA